MVSRFRPERSAAVRSVGGAAFCRRGTRGSVPLDRRSGAFRTPPDSTPQPAGRFDDLARLNQLKLEEAGDPEIATRIAQYELAYRMQSAAPELTDISGEPEHILEAYGPQARKPGTYAANCLLARRMAERGVRFIQLFHRGWDQHTTLPANIARQAEDTDQPTAALIEDWRPRAAGRHAGGFWRRAYRTAIARNAHARRLRL